MRKITINEKYAGQVRDENMQIEFVCRAEDCDEVIRTTKRGRVECPEGHIHLVEESE